MTDEPPPDSSMIAAVTIRGPVRASAVAPSAYVGPEKEIQAKLGPLLLVVKGADGWESIESWCEQILALGRRLYPQTDLFDEHQRFSDQHIARYGGQSQNLKSNQRRRPDSGVSL